MFNSAVFSRYFFQNGTKMWKSLYLSSGPAQGLVSASWQRLASTNGEEWVRECKREQDQRKTGSVSNASKCI